MRQKICLKSKKFWGGAQKIQKNLIFWTPKIENIIFSEIGNSQIWWTIGGGQDSATGHPDTLRTFGSIRFL